MLITYRNNIIRYGKAFVTNVEVTYDITRVKEKSTGITATKSKRLRLIRHLGSMNNDKSCCY